MSSILQGYNISKLKFEDFLSEHLNKNENLAASSLYVLFIYKSSNSNKIIYPVLISNKLILIVSYILFDIQIY